MTSACKSSTCAAGFDKVEFAYDGEGHRTKVTTTRGSDGEVATRDFRYQGDAIVEETLTDPAHPSGAVVRRYVVDDAGSTVKLVIPTGEPEAGTYLVTWSGHGDALALWRQEPDGTLSLANSYQYDTWGRPTTATHAGIADLGFRFLYVGEFDVQWDDAFGLDLLYMHARHYSPTLDGIFLQSLVDIEGLEVHSRLIPSFLPNTLKGCSRRTCAADRRAEMGGRPWRDGRAPSPSLVPIPSLRS